MKKNIFEYYITKFGEINIDVIIAIVKNKMQSNKIISALKEYDYLIHEYYYYNELLEANKGLYNSDMQLYKDNAIYISKSIKELLGA